MPRPPRFIHPLRLLRSSTSHSTQEAFAQLIGVSRPTIQALENGKLRLTARLAARIREVTGAGEKELLLGQGAPKTADGKPFTRHFFDQWHQKKRSQAEADHAGQVDAAQLSEWMRILLDASRQGPDLERLSAAKRLLAESMDQIQGKLELLDAINAQLVPYQQVTSKTVEVSQWKKEKPRVAASLGWSPQLAAAIAQLTSRSRLTLSVQLSPYWAPSQIPPDTLSANLDLLPPSYFCLGFGKAGCEIAHLFMKQLCREHGISTANGKALKSEPGGNWTSFFRKVRTDGRGERFVPRVVFADLDQAAMGDLAGRLPDLYHPGSLITGSSGGGNFFGASRGEEGRALVEGARQFIARQGDDTGGPSALLLFLSLEGGTGTGLAEQFLLKIRQENPSIPILVIAVLPSTEVSHVVAAPYHACLALNSIFSSSNQCYLIENSSFSKLAAREWKILAPETRHVNDLAVESLLSLTAPLRFPGQLSSPWRIEELLHCHGPSAPSEGGGKSARLLRFGSLPLRALVPPRVGQSTSQAIMKAGAGRLPFEPSAGSALSLFLRGRSPQARGTRDTHTSVPHIHLADGRPLFAQQNLTMVSESPEHLEAIRKLTEQARQMVQRQAFLHWYREAGIGADEVLAAIDSVQKRVEAR